MALYEIREYVALPGRLPTIIELFNELTIPLFAKHGMELVNIGRTWIGEDSLNELVYTMRFADVAELENKWAKFLARSGMGRRPDRTGSRGTAIPVHQTQTARSGAVHRDSGRCGAH